MIRHQKREKQANGQMVMRTLSHITTIKPNLIVPSLHLDRDINAAKLFIDCGKSVRMHLASGAVCFL